MRIQFPPSPHAASARLNTTRQRYQQGQHSICKPDLLAPVVTKWMELDTGPQDPGTGSCPTPSCLHISLGPGPSGSLPQGRRGSVAGRGSGHSGPGVGRQQLLQGWGPGLTLEMLQAPRQLRPCACVDGCLPSPRLHRHSCTSVLISSPPPCCPVPTHCQGAMGTNSLTAPPTLPESPEGPFHVHRLSALYPCWSLPAAHCFLSLS